MKKQSRKLAIRGKIFTLTDLGRLANIFRREFDRAKKSEHQADLTFEVRFENGTAFEGEDVSLFSEDTMAYDSRPTRVECTFVNYTMGRRMSMSLDHGDARDSNQISVRASEDKWLMATFTFLEEALRTVRPQNDWPRRWSFAIILGVSFSIGSLALWLMQWAALTIRGPGIPLLDTQPPHSTSVQIALVLVVKWIAALVIGLLFSPWTAQILTRSWPDIEFAFGLPHLHVEEKQRRVLKWVLSVVVIPLLLSVAYDGMKFFALQPPTANIGGGASTNAPTNEKR